MDNDDDDHYHHRHRQQQQQQQQQQQRQRRLRLQQHPQQRSTTTVLHQQQPAARRRAVPARRSCSAVTEREMMVAGTWQPSRQHLIKRPSRVYRELCLAWNSRVGSQNTNAPAHRVQALFNDLGLYPTSAQVTEMMQCVMKCANRGSPVYMTFGEYYLLVKKLKNGLDKGIPRSVQFSRLLEKNQEKHVRSARKNSRSAHGYDVFLGGSCNPTTWRKDVAIPYLQDAGVSFYNPQVDHWSQDLIEIEHAAKENASVLLFVIDSQTRNVVSDIETAYLAGHHKNLVLVIHPQDAVAGSVVAGERISCQEAQDIRDALTVLHQIAATQGITVFDNITQALNLVVQMLKDKNHLNCDYAESSSTSYRRIRDAFDMFDTNAMGKINICDVGVAVRFLAGRNLPENEVLKIISEHNDPKAVGGNCQVCFTFDQFYSIACKCLQLPDNCRTTNQCSTVSRSLQNTPQEPVETAPWSPRTTDIYLAGESGDDIRWREDIAIPMIKKSNLTYHAAARTDLSVLSDSRTLLFVIPNNSRSLATMTLAAYCIAKSCRMVLCIQNLSKDNCTVRDEMLTQTAINDYNRGRSYLTDLASREQVPVFESITDAVQTAIQKSL